MYLYCSIRMEVVRDSTDHDVPTTRVSFGNSS